ncbi:MAG: D-alanine--D-alanine ligase [Candidatus Pacebacteria bacterium]|nr:D-alanine--D-alanine ligase [Candidatus Paceibacterota bacterium]
MKRVAVLRGGPSDEYDVSMKSGSAVIHALKNLDYDYKDIVITKKGEWLESGFTKESQVALEGIDVVFIALHGQYGEDGQVQKILQRLNIPFTGSRSLPSAVAFNKELTKRTLKAHNIKLPRHRLMLREEMNALDSDISTIFSDIGNEVFVKPVASGSSLGARYVPNEETLRVVLKDLFQVYDKVLIEQFIRGREATVGVLDNFREEQFYSLPVVEIVPPGGEPIFSNEIKYSGKAEEIVPGRFSYAEKTELAEVAALVHQVIDCSHYSRSDFIVRDGEIYFLEVNTLPGLTSESLFPKAAAAVGLEFPQLVQHLIETAQV